MRKTSFLIIVLFFVFALSLANAQETNITDQEKAINCLDDSWLIHQELASENFSITRINDTIREGESILEIQQALEEKGRSTDYANIFEICEEIIFLRDLAFQLRDEIKVLEEFYESSPEGMDIEKIEPLFSSIYKEMKSERYELVPDLIEQTYSEIILAQSQLATLNVFYNATTRGLKRFIQERWIELLIGMIALVLLIWGLWKPVEKMILKKQMASLEIRRGSLKDMISKNQDLFFNKGKISEDSFTTKNKKLAELIRDVDRQISLIKEQIYAIEGKKVTKKKLKKKHKK